MEHDRNDKTVIRKLLGNLGLWIPISYIYASFIGSIYSLYLFREFGVNIFDFVDAEDLFLFAFVTPWTIWATVSVAIISFIVWKLLKIIEILWLRSQRLIDKEIKFRLTDKEIKSVMKFMRIGLMIYATLGGSHLFASSVARYRVGDIEDGKLRGLEVHLVQKSKDQLKILENVILLGSAGDFIVFVDWKKNISFVINKTEIFNIVIADASRLLNISKQKKSSKKQNAKKSQSKNQ